MNDLLGRFFHKLYVPKANNANATRRAMNSSGPGHAPGVA
jgi:hypothetical protein